MEGIQGRHMTCVLGDILLWSHVSFDLSPGECLWVKGPNGVGKSTFLKILVGLEALYEGEVSFDSSLRWCYLPPQLHAIEDLCPRDMLMLWSGLFSVSPKEISYAVDFFDVSDFIDVPFSHISLGQKQRFHMVQLLLSKSDVWVIDEPFSSLDRGNIQRVKELLICHQNRGGMVIVASHTFLSYQKVLSFSFQKNHKNPVVHHVL